MKSAGILVITVGLLLAGLILGIQRVDSGYSLSLPHTPFTVCSSEPATVTLYLPLILREWPVALSIPITVWSDSGTLQDVPVTVGVPLPEEANVTAPDGLRLLASNGKAIPVQVTPLARWGGPPDDKARPIRWALLDFQTPITGMVTYTLTTGRSPSPSLPISIVQTSERIDVLTGAAAFTLDKATGLLYGAFYNGIGFTATLGVVRLESGEVYTATGPFTVTILPQTGKMRASLEIQGNYGSGLGFTSRLWFYSGLPYVRLFHTVENRNLCQIGTYNGQPLCWDIGSAGSITLADLSIPIEIALSGTMTVTVGGCASQDKPCISTWSVSPLPGAITLYQDSSGTDYWDRYRNFYYGGEPVDTHPRMQSYVSFRGFRVNLNQTTVFTGDQAQGWVALEDLEEGLLIGVRDFWQNFPKALRIRPPDETPNAGALIRRLSGTGAEVEVGLFPEEFAGPLVLRPGEHKTHEILIAFYPVGKRTALTAWLSASVHALVPITDYVKAFPLGPLAPRQRDAWPDYENYIDWILETSPYWRDDIMTWSPNLLASIRERDFYGIFDYGDVPLDYEGYGVAPMNHKYNFDYGMWAQYLRSGDPRWFRLAWAACRHIADIDVLHNLHTPRHWADGGFYGHSQHDEAGFVNPHRNHLAPHPDTTFGFVGLMACYYLTGYEKAYHTAMEIAENILYRFRNTSALCDYFPDCTGTGYALVGRYGLYHDNERPAANGLLILTEAFRATGDARYLEVADALVDWARADRQPYISGPTGEADYLKPWMLNLYLVALGRYVEVRQEFGLGDPFGGSQSLIQYADFLRRHVWLDLEPIETGPRGAYPYRWWFDGRSDNRHPSINNWLLLGADAMAYAYRFSGDGDFLERAERLFRTGSRDPWFEGDYLAYNSTKEAANQTVFGMVFLSLGSR